MSDDDDDEWLVERVGPGSSEKAVRRARIAQYRRHAADIRVKAENMKDQTVRQQLLDIARQYEALATSIERLPLRRRE
jgi:hypothetical protein